MKMLCNAVNLTLYCVILCRVINTCVHNASYIVVMQYIFIHSCCYVMLCRVMLCYVWCAIISRHHSLCQSIYIAPLHSPRYLLRGILESHVTSYYVKLCYPMSWRLIGLYSNLIHWCNSRALLVFLTKRGSWQALQFKAMLVLMPANSLKHMRDLNMLKRQTACGSKNINLTKILKETA